MRSLNSPEFRKRLNSGEFSYDKHLIPARATNNLNAIGALLAWRSSRRPDLSIETIATKFHLETLRDDLARSVKLRNERLRS